MNVYGINLFFLVVFFVVNGMVFFYGYFVVIDFVVDGWYFLYGKWFVYFV